MRRTKRPTPYAAQTVANTVKVLKAAFAFGVREEVIVTDPTHRVAVPNVPRRDYKIFDPSDVDTLLQACNVKTLTGMGDFAFIMLLFDSGIRALELVTITDADVDWRRGLILVYGKGAKERQVPVSPRTFRAIRRYQTERKEAGYTDTATLFVNHKGDALTRYGLNQILERLGNRTGLHVHPQRFRHNFAVNALRNDAREYDIQDVLGHTTLQMTKRYARQSGEDLAKRHGRFSPA